MQTLHNTPSYRLSSYGWGQCYILINKNQNLDILFQGDDALELDYTLSYWERKGHSYESILSNIWEAHSAAAQSHT